MACKQNIAMLIKYDIITVGQIKYLKNAEIPILLTWVYNSYDPFIF